MPAPSTALAPRLAGQRVSLAWLRHARWVGICWIVVFWRLGYSSLLDPDEAHYAEMTREMLHSGSWLVPLLNGQPFIDKPVLFHWLQGASVALLGESEFAARVPSAIAAIVLFAITRYTGTVLFGAEVGEWGAIMFATVPATFALASIGLFDMVFATFLFGGVACLLVAAREGRPHVENVGYVLLAFAVMTKGPVALLLVGLFIVAASVAGSDTRQRITALHWKAGLCFVVLAASPWFVWMQARFGEQFVNGYLLAGNLWYFTQPEVFSGRAVSHTFYARVFASAFFPWSAIVIGRGVDLIRGFRSGMRLETDEKLLWIWTIVIVGFFSAARFKLDHYIFPAAPSCCLLAAYAWRRASQRLDASHLGTHVSVFVVAAVLIVGGAFSSVYMFQLNIDLPRTALALPVALTVGGILLMAQAARHQWSTPATAIVPAMTLLASYLVIVSVGYPVLEHTRASAYIGRRMRQLTSADAPTAVYRLERWRASLRYYIDRPLERFETPAEVKTFLSRKDPVYVVLLRREYEALEKDGVPIKMLMQQPAIVGTTGTGLRRQRWGFLVVATNEAGDRTLNGER
jgi:4-amino-4-deoxy-L-arabinose transferase-like glycosyltransferase